MLVKENKFIKPTFTTPRIAKPGRTTAEIKNNSLYINNLYEYIADMFKENKDTIDWSKKYYVGFKGSYLNEISIYKGTYFPPKNKTNLHYVEVTTMSEILHIRSYSSANLIIKNFFMTEGEPDIVIPNKKDFIEDVKAYYPPEGDYKEIQPQ